MRRLILLLTLPALACGLVTPAPQPTAPTAGSVSITAPPPTAIPASETPAATQPLAGPTRLPRADDYEWRLVVSGLERPVDVQSARDGTGRLFVIEKIGRIRIIENGNLADAPFLNIEDRVGEDDNEQGLLGLTFHPDFKNNGFFYVNYTKHNGDTVIARFTAAGNFADPNSELKLIGVNQPFPNHNGGALAFGPDGFLYIGLGDGGAANDPFGNGQKLTTFLGKILRIDVNNGDAYSIPAGNPFGDEVWAYGLRNPWRISFDSLSGDLWIGDVGQGDWEEIDFVPAGTAGGINFGWDRYEGGHDFASGPNLQNHWPPLFEYSHADTFGGCSVTGGYVYRGALPEWQGVYFYGDYCTGYIWAALRVVNGDDDTFTSTLFFETGALITTFGVDESGELYFASDGGQVYMLVAK